MLKQGLGGRYRLIFIIALLLSGGFIATSLVSYLVSRSVIRDSIVLRELPLTSDNIYSEIQKDLIRPVFISSMMSRDTFLRDWVISGERESDRIVRFLREIKNHYGTFTSFFISDRSRKYYYYDGLLKDVSESEPRDAWYFRVRSMAAPYEINVDPDLANRDALTIFINFRVQDYDGRFLGAAGVGLTVDAVRKLVDEYEKRYQRSVYFVSTNGQVMLSGLPSVAEGTNLARVQGLADVFSALPGRKEFSANYLTAGENHLLNVRFLPELNWYLFVERVEDEALSAIRSTLAMNIVVCLAITLLVLFLTTLTIRRFQVKLEDLATRDNLTGMANRTAFEIHFGQAQKEMQRNGLKVALVLMDLDHFKAVNDTYGHIAGDEMLKGVADITRRLLRDSDILCRWGGEEFTILMKGCTGKDAREKAEAIRVEVQSSVIRAGGNNLTMTVSMGVAELLTGDSLGTLLQRADRALYCAKETGRNKVCADIPG